MRASRPDPSTAGPPDPLRARRTRRAKQRGFVFVARDQAAPFFAAAWQGDADEPGSVNPCADR